MTPARKLGHVLVWLLPVSLLVSGCGSSAGDNGSAAGGSTASGGGGTGATAGAAGNGGTGGTGDEPCSDHCHDGLSNCGEEGVDCGGDCPPCEEGLTIRGSWLGIVGADDPWRVGISTGHLRYHAGLFDQMTATGKNLFNNNRAGAGGYGIDSALAYQNGHLGQGWNEAFWSDLEGYFQEARDQDIGVIVNVWGTVALEGQRDQGCWNAGTQQWTCRWDVHPYNAQVGKGGPYNLPGCGKDSFFTFHDYDQVVYAPGDSYPAGADMSTRGQWRQEEYLHKLASLCSHYPNVAISLVWEAHDLSSHTWGNCGTTEVTMESWHRHMSDFIRSISPATLVATATMAYRTSCFADLDFLTSEANAANGLQQWEEDSEWTKPVVYTGWTAFNSQGNSCGKTCASADYAYVRSRIRGAWTQGVQLGSPFWEYKANEPDTYEVEIDPYLAALRQSLDTIESWEDEPGVELTEGALPAP